MDTSVAAAEKGAQHPAHDADQESHPRRRCQICRRESPARGLKPRTASKPFTTKDEKAKREQNQRRGENKQYWTHESVQNPKQQRGTDERADSVITDPANDGGGHNHSDGCDCQRKTKCLIAKSIELRRSLFSLFRLRKSAAWRVKDWPTQSKSKWRKVQKNLKRKRPKKAQKTDPNGIEQDPAVGTRAAIEAKRAGKSPEGKSGGKVATRARKTSAERKTPPNLPRKPKRSGFRDADEEIRSALISSRSGECRIDVPATRRGLAGSTASTVQEGVRQTRMN